MAGVWSSKYSVAESQTARIVQVDIDGNSMLISQWFSKKKVDWVVIPKTNIHFGNNKPSSQAYKNPEWLGAPESRHIRIMYLGKSLGLGSSVESGTAQRQLKRFEV